MSRTTQRTLALAAALLFLLAGPASAKDKVYEDEKQNVIVRIPGEGSGAWEWLTSKPEWAKAGIVKAARRVVTKLKNGKQPNGQGAILFVTVHDVGEETTAAEAAESDDIRGPFLARFVGTPTVEQEESTIESGTSLEDGHPCVILRAEGEGNNLKAKKAPCNGVLVVATHEGKAYALRMYAFPTEFDEEGVALDLDWMEGTALKLINTKAKKAEEGPKPVANGGGEKPSEGEEKEEKKEDETIEHREQKWRITIDKKLTRLPLTEEDDEFNMVLKIEDNDPNGGVLLYLYAPQTTQYVDGVKAAPPNLAKWMTEDWWNSFTTTHPEGDLFTYKWPSKPEGKNPTFLTVPYLDDEENRLDVVTGGKKRPVEVTLSDARKMGFAEKPKKNKIGKKGKGGEAMRGCLEGMRPRVGKETVLRYAWRSPTHSYRLFVIFTRDGYKKYGEPMRRTLESMEFGLKFK